VADDERAALLEGATAAQSMGNALKRQQDDEVDHVTKAKELDEAVSLTASGRARLEKFDADIKRSQAELDQTPYDHTLHQNLVVAKEGARRIAELAPKAAQAKAKAENTELLESCQRAIEESERLHRDALKLVGEVEAEQRSASQAHAAAHLQQGLAPGDSCPVCGEEVTALPQLVAPNLEHLERRATQAKEAERRTQRESREASEALIRAKSDHDAAVKSAQDLAAELGDETRVLGQLLPEGLEVTEDAVGKRLRMEEKAYKKRSELTETVSKLGRQRDELSRELAESAAKVASLQGTLEALEINIRRAQSDVAEQRLILTKLIDEHAWDDVGIALKEGAEDPSIVVQRRLRNVEAAVAGLIRLIGSLQEKEERIREGITRAEELRADLKRAQEREGLFRTLGQLLRTDGFRRFVREEAMLALATAGSDHLLAMYPRFALAVESDEFQVIDHWQADELRPASTLSGGETFVASLSLALALAEQLPSLRSAAAFTLESLFLDEGFGTLDPDTLDTVIGAVESLRAQERLVGIITHVPDLANRIECRIEVSKSPGGSSINLVSV
jgi:exonuclease SbcC